MFYSFPEQKAGTKKGQTSTSRIKVGVASGSLLCDFPSVTWEAMRGIMRFIFSSACLQIINKIKITDNTRSGCWAPGAPQRMPGEGQKVATSVSILPCGVGSQLNTTWLPPLHEYVRRGGFVRSQGCSMRLTVSILCARGRRRPTIGRHSRR